MYLSVARKIASQLPLIKISALQCGCIADANAPLHRCLHTCLCWNDWCWDLQLPLHFVCQHISCQLPGPLRRTDDSAEGSAVRQPSVVSAGCCFLWVFIYSWGWFSGIPSGIQFPRAGGFSCLDSIIFTFGSIGSSLVATKKMNQAFHKCSRSDSCTIPALYPPFLEGGIHNPSISRSFLTSKDDAWTSGVYLGILAHWPAAGPKGLGVLDVFGMVSCWAICCYICTYKKLEAPTSHHYIYI